MAYAKIRRPRRRALDFLIAGMDGSFDPRIRASGDSVVASIKIATCVAGQRGFKPSSASTRPILPIPTLIPGVAI